ncbi:MAG TPA: squalene/phytoene synthase family protein [candidate division Zixibacteria bacterium]|nr:squalene/phytoene synthase family protein [candidate division Zixibacteria bacterium]MDD4918305.1 squalene/phytoene synthase family protein [candidate division Zixibacteria bacterium]MDM7974011.1 squalene/phytoene synthase family protein [candidate division Zixibacteria bacterium]HOD66773.1 squalene/phytoene synthase family protein [candidate division Zixibacteria bacterium]HPM38360.1 squalene/phytoene synthase family protein [candidate division Zixibacteria bacterium]
MKTRTPIDFALDLDFREILTNPILDIAARVWEDDRYEAFRVCYRSMRIIDDLVDNQKAGGRTLAVEEQCLFASMIDDWINSLRRGRPADAFQEQFLETLHRYRLPLWPWEKLAEAMVYDLYHNGFATFREFLRYTEGAAVAPASVFMHLCAVRPHATGILEPAFDIRRAARPLAVFSYLVHIMRDFRKDQTAHLQYFADDLMAEEGAAPEDLQQAARGGEIVRPVRDLMGRYRELAERYRRISRRMLDRVQPDLAPRYGLSLEIIYQLYLQIFERVDPRYGDWSAAELQPPPAAVQARIEATIRTFRAA